MLKIKQLQINFYTFIKNILKIYVFVQSQAQKYDKIFLVFREIRAKMERKKKDDTEKNRHHLYNHNFLVK